MLEFLQKSWFVLGFIAYVISWIWQVKRNPDQSKLRIALTALIVAAATIVVLLMITATLS